MSVYRLSIAETSCAAVDLAFSGVPIYRQSMPASTPWLWSLSRKRPSFHCSNHSTSRSVQASRSGTRPVWLRTFAPMAALGLAAHAC
jgi:hypothetical protein